MKRLAALILFFTIPVMAQEVVRDPSKVPEVIPPSRTTATWDKGKVMVIADPEIVKAILTSDLPADEKRQALDSYFRLGESQLKMLSDAESKRASEKGNNILAIAGLIISVVSVTVR